MALDVTQLATDIQAVLDSFPISSAASANGFAAAYKNYAAGGTFLDAVPVFTGSEQSAMAATLDASLTVPGLPITAAGGWATSVLAFWMTPPIACLGPSHVGVVISEAGAAGLVASMSAQFAIIVNTRAVQAAAMAAALHAATVGQVIALLIPPPGGAPVPIA